MADHDLSETQLEELARMIYVEVQRQIDGNWPANSAIIEAGSLRNVLIEGHIDLLKIATALATRCGLSMPEIETVGDARRVFDPHRRDLPRS
jgi:hypothetical protein